MCDFSSKWGYLVKSCFLVQFCLTQSSNACRSAMSESSLYGRETRGRPILTWSTRSPSRPPKETWDHCLYCRVWRLFLSRNDRAASLRLPQYTAGNGSVAATVPRSGELENIWSLFWFASPALISNVCWACSWMIAKDRKGFISRSSLP